MLLLTKFNQDVRVSFESLVEVTFLQHQDIFFLSDLSPAGHSQCADEQKLQHSCRRVFFLTEKTRAADTVGYGSAGGNSSWFWSVFLVKGWESSWYFVSTATNVALHAETGGVSPSAHAHLSGRKRSC